MTISEQDYLKVIYELGGSNRLVSNKEISEALDLSPPSVSEMIKRLTTRGFISYEPYKGITLSDKGIEKALEVVRRHQIWELWLTKELGYPLHMVHEEAERLEHAMSEELEKRLFEYLGSPTHGAMGERILTIGKINDDQPTCPLAECDIEKSLKISWIEDDSELLKYFETLGLQLNDKVVILDKAPFSGPITLKKNSKEIVIGHMAASKIHMILLEE